VRRGWCFGAPRVVLGDPPLCPMGTRGFDGDPSPAGLAGAPGTIDVQTLELPNLARRLGLLYLDVLRTHARAAIGGGRWAEATVTLEWAVTIAPHMEVDSEEARTLRRELERWRTHLTADPPQDPHGHPKSWTPLYTPPAHVAQWLSDHVDRAHHEVRRRATDRQLVDRNATEAAAQLAVHRTVIQTLAHSVMQSKAYQSEAQGILEALRPQVDRLVQALAVAFSHFIKGTTAATLRTFRGILRSDFRTELWSICRTTINAYITFNGPAWYYVPRGLGTPAEAIYCYVWLAAHAHPYLELYASWPDDRTPNEIRCEHLFEGERLLQTADAEGFEEWIANFPNIPDGADLRVLFRDYATKQQHCSSQIATLAFHRVQIREHETLKARLEAQSTVTRRHLASSAPSPLTPLLEEEAAASLASAMDALDALRVVRPSPSTHTSLDRVGTGNPITIVAEASGNLSEDSDQYTHWDFDLSLPPGMPPDAMVTVSRAAVILQAPGPHPVGRVLVRLTHSGQLERSCHAPRHTAVVGAVARWAGGLETHISSQGVFAVPGDGATVALRGLETATGFSQPPGLDFGAAAEAEGDAEGVGPLAFADLGAADDGTFLELDPRAPWRVSLFDPVWGAGSRGTVGLVSCVVLVLLGRLIPRGADDDDGGSSPNPPPFVGGGDSASVRWRVLTEEASDNPTDCHSLWPHHSASGLATVGVSL